MIHFAQPLFLYLLILIPLFFIVFGVIRSGNKRRVSRFGDPVLFEKLTPLVSKRKGWVKLTFFSLGLFFLIIGLARPQIGATLKEQEVKGVEIMIALDVSNSMLAEDYSPNRLERAKLAISKIVDKLQSDRIGLVVFAGQSFVQLPITTDYVSAKIFLNTINTESVPVQGTAMGDAIVTCIKSFSSQAENSKAIVIITDGENHEDDPVQAAKDAVEMGIRVFCVGVGSSEGKPIPFKGELLKDKEGNIVVTRLDETILREVASAGNGVYVRAGNSEFGLNPIIDDIKNMDAQKFQSVVFEDFDEQYMYFFAVALFFFLIDFLISSKRNRRKLFKGSRPAAIVTLFLISSLSMFAQVDRSQVRAGNRAFKKGNFQKSEVDYKRALIDDSTSVTAHYNLGNTLYKMENFPEAAKSYQGLADTLKKGDPLKASQYFHNLGNVSLKEKKYQEAVDAFKESLRKNPSDIQTKSNLAYAQKLLKNQQQQQQQNQDQNKDQNQDQNQDQNKDQNQDQNKDQNQDQNKDQNQDQNKDQNQDQNKDQNKDQNQDQNKDQNQGNQQQTPPKISPQAAQQMLQAIEDKEKETQDKVKKEKAAVLKSKQKEKNW
jgi:tetratricopeptide (TPR) repeat protein